MTPEKLEALLSFPPVEIEDIFFERSRFKFNPSLSTSPKAVDLDLFRFSSNVIVLDKNAKKIQVCVEVQSEPSDQDSFEFYISCVGLYTWTGQGELNEDTIKIVYGWAVAIQIGAIRHHIAQETTRGPYHAPWFFPIGLVKVQEKEDKHVESKGGQPPADRITIQGQKGH